MSDLTIGLSVTTPDIEEIVGPFTLADGNAEVVIYDPGGIVKRRRWLRSPSVRGARQQGSQPEQRLLRLQLRIYGTSKANLDANVDLWLQVFDQSRYHTTFTVNGVDTEWFCDDADVEIVNDSGAGVDKFRLMASPMRQVYEFRIPTDPDPTVGVI